MLLLSAGMIAQARRYISAATPSTPPHPPLYPEANGEGPSSTALSMQMRPTPSPGIESPLSLILLFQHSALQYCYQCFSMACVLSSTQEGHSHRTFLLPGVVRRLSENGGLSPADSLGTAASGTLDGMSDVDRKQRELYTRQQQLLREQRTADQEKLLATISGVRLALFTQTHLYDHSPLLLAMLIILAA